MHLEFACEAGDDDGDEIESMTLLSDCPFLNWWTCDILSRTDEVGMNGEVSVAAIGMEFSMIILLTSTARNIGFVDRNEYTATQ